MAAYAEAVADALREVRRAMLCRAVMDVWLPCMCCLVPRVLLLWVRGPVMEHVMPVAWGCCRPDC